MATDKTPKQVVVEQQIAEANTKFNIAKNRFDQLFDAKAHKIIDQVLTQRYHTQISYLPKDQQELELLVGKAVVYDFLLHYLTKL